MGYSCDQFAPILRVVSYIVGIMRWALPIILIVVTSLDYFKIVSNSNVDEKMVKDANKKMTSRLVYAIIIFLIPVFVKLLFKMVNNLAPSDFNSGTSWVKCIDSYF